ncbi:hypothetical protein GQ55_7G098900 [Panicum hallii var. hallii]|uniref:Uncharacterized protein n=1 Tax=Panicum hallii var. hallii TaxID=1504633 RepID=A0A2T7CTM2_9POAL|nr:hypothetical protein GQ55_7G098900 [Panicum hallii var. hallii]
MPRVGARGTLRTPAPLPRAARARSGALRPSASRTARRGPPRLLRAPVLPPRVAHRSAPPSTARRGVQEPLPLQALPRPRRGARLPLRRPQQEQSAPSRLLLPRCFPAASLSLWPQRRRSSLRRRKTRESFVLPCDGRFSPLALARSPCRWAGSHHPLALDG